MEKRQACVWLHRRIFTKAQDDSFYWTETARIEKFPVLATQGEQQFLFIKKSGRMSGVRFASVQSPLIEAAACNILKQNTFSLLSVPT